MKMKVAVFFLCLALAVVLSHGLNDIEEDLEEYMLEDMLGDGDFDFGDVTAQNWFKKAFKKAKNLGKKAYNGVKKGVQTGCGMVNQLPSKELAFRVSMAFPELISEDGYSETADVRKLVNGVRKACGLVG